MSGRTQSRPFGCYVCYTKIPSTVLRLRALDKLPGGFKSMQNTNKRISNLLKNRY